MVQFPEKHARERNTKQKQKRKEWGVGGLADGRGLEWSASVAPGAWLPYEWDEVSSATPALVSAAPWDPSRAGHAPSTIRYRSQRGSRRNLSATAGPWCRPLPSRTSARLPSDHFVPPCAAVPAAALHPLRHHHPPPFLPFSLLLLCSSRSGFF